MEIIKWNGNDWYVSILKYIYIGWMDEWVGMMMMEKMTFESK